jgi:hypothetical protein
MSSLALTLEPPVQLSAPSPVDCEAAAGGEEARPRVLPPTLVYHGQDEAHWHGQPCYAPDPHELTASCVLVVFACGCRALVAPSCLERNTATSV